MQRVVCLLLLLLPALIHGQELLPYNGDPLPDFVLSDLDGTQHRLSNYRGTTVMVNFWATYCTPCISELPSMRRLQEKLRDRPFTILAVNMAETRAELDAFLKQYEIRTNFPLLLDADGSVATNWQITAIPITFIIGPDGMIRYTLFGGIEWDKPDIVATIGEILK